MMNGRFHHTLLSIHEYNQFQPITRWPGLRAYGPAQHDRGGVRHCCGVDYTYVHQITSTLRQTAWQLLHGFGRRYIPKKLLKHYVTSVIVCRWLLKRTHGISVLHTRGQCGKSSLYVRLNDENRRDQQIALTTIPLISRLLSPQASLHLDLSWGMSAQYSHMP